MFIPEESEVWRSVEITEDIQVGGFCQAGLQVEMGSTPKTMPLSWQHAAPPGTGNLGNLNSYFVTHLSRLSLSKLEISHL